MLRVRGALVCAGIPITATSFVVTADHCVLDPAGNVAAVTVVRDGIERSPGEVLVNRRYHDTPRPELDAAVFVMDGAVPGPSATMGDAVPTTGFVTPVGFQPLDTDGTLLRGTSYHDRPMPKGVTGGVMRIESRPTGCVHTAASILTPATQLTAPCGLIQGASGGGLFEERRGGGSQRALAMVDHC